VIQPTIIVSLYRGWRSGYDCRHVNAIARALAAYMTIPYQLVCVTDIPAGITECETYPLWDVGVGKVGYGKPNCFWRLRLHDKEFGRQFGERPVLSIPLRALTRAVVAEGDVTSVGFQHSLARMTHRVHSRSLSRISHDGAT
jgi:hypothetical protein